MIDYMHACKFTCLSSVVSITIYKDKKERILHAQATFDSEEEKRTMPSHGWSSTQCIHAMDGWSNIHDRRATLTMHN